MMMIALGEILVVLLIRPVRFLFGGARTPIGRAALRFEHWLLHHLHIMGAESRMRDELGRHGAATSFLADGLSDQTSVLPSTSDTVQRIRSESGADHDEAMQSAERFGQPELERGQRHVESRGGDRTDDIHEAMLQAQREKRQRTERERRRSLGRRR